MDLSKYNKAEVLCALFNRAKKTKEFWHGYQEFSVEEALIELDANDKHVFHTLYGRELHVDLQDMSSVDLSKYNSYNGDQLAERMIKRLRHE